MKKNISTALFRVVFVLSFLLTLIGPAQVSVVYAAGTLTMEMITWDIIGLDSNNVDVGPNTFPVGTRVCNTNTVSSVTVDVEFFWDDTQGVFSPVPGDPAPVPAPDLYINLRAGTLKTIALTIPAAIDASTPSCKDAYFEAQVERNSNAYDNTRGYYITATDQSDGTNTTTIPEAPLKRQLYVEYLISQNRNSSGTSVAYGPHGGTPVSVNNGGTMTFMVGQEYDIEVTGFTATQGYEQFEAFINLPNIIFQVLSVSSSYTANSTGGHISDPNDKLYADACNSWESNPSSPNYPSCQSTGKVGGDLVQTYHVKILQVPDTPLVNPVPINTMLYDYSGSSFHYNADFSASTVYANIISPATIKKSFVENTVAPNETSILTYTIKNDSSNTLSNVNFKDTTGWPAGVEVAATTVTPTNCGTPLPSALTIGDTSASFTNITVAANSTCTISIVVKAASDGIYKNTTENLFIGDLNTGSKAAASLVVSSTPPNTYDCGTDKIKLVTWNFDAGDGGTVAAPNYTGLLTTGVSSASATANLGSAGVASFAADGLTSGVNSWRIQGGFDLLSGLTLLDHTHTPSFQFEVDSSNYSNVEIRASIYLDGSGDYGNPADNLSFVHTSSDGGTTWVDETVGDPNKKGQWHVYNGADGGIWHIAAGTATGSSTTTFLINQTGVASKKTTAAVMLDDVEIWGCARPVPPTLAKSFSPTPIGSDTTVPPENSLNYSDLTFTIGNPNTGILSGVKFNDTLPDGLVVANPPTVTAPSCTTGTLTGQTITAAAGTNTIGMVGGVLSASATNCTFSVRVQGLAAGVYVNKSNRIDSDSAGLNTTGGDNEGYGLATLTVIDPPVISKVFGSSEILKGETTTLKFRIANSNKTTAITGIAFTDPLPVGLDVSGATINDACGAGSTVTITANTAPTPDTIALTNGVIAADSFCEFTVTVTGTTPSSTVYTNTTSTVTSTNAGTGEPAEAKVFVRDKVPGLTLEKLVSATGADDDWSTNVALIPAGSSVYYKFVVTNSGDFPLTDIKIVDTDIPHKVDTSSCVWASLPTYNADQDEVVTCELGPITPASAGYVTNTATAVGTHLLANDVTSNPDTATYQNGNFGHLPYSTYGLMNVFEEGGAFHLTGSTYLGTSVPNETDGSKSDAYAPDPTYDDGVSPTGTWKYGVTGDSNGGSTSVDVTCESDPCYLSAWVDWNGDGDFDDTNEQIIGTSVNDGTSQSFTFDIPVLSGKTAGDTVDGTFYVRFRVYESEPDTVSPNGIAKTSSVPTVGEVEDYEWTVTGGTAVSTPVTLSYFRAQRQGGSVNFEWSTETESGNVGFNLYAEDGEQLVRINDELIPSHVVDSLSRQDYTFTANLKANTFYIEDVSISNETELHGPFQSGKKYGDLHEANLIDWAGIQSVHNAEQATRQGQLRVGLETSAAVLSADAMVDVVSITGTSINLKVQRTGIHRVSYGMLKSAGLDLAGVSKNKIVLTNGGGEIPIFVGGKAQFGPGSYIDFYGEALDTVYTDTNIYTLQVGKTRATPNRMDKRLPKKGVRPPTAYMETIVVNNQRAYANYAPGTDAWYDISMLVYTTPKTWEFPFTVSALANLSDAAALELTVWGVTDWPADLDHHLQVSVNGVPVADETFNGLVEKTLQISLPAGVLKRGQNTLQLSLPGDTGVKYEMVNFDKLSITFSRAFVAQNGRLSFRAAGEVLRVTNLPTDKVIVYRMTAKGLVRVTNVRVRKVAENKYSAIFPGTRWSSQYFVTANTKIYRPKLELSQSNVDLNRPADYLVISHPDFIAGLQPLVQARQAQGYTVSVVDVNDLYAQYSNGILTPDAIKKYIAYAARNLGTKQVLLVGGDTYDYRNYLGKDSISFIPSLYVKTGEFASFVPVDPLYTDLNDDQIPDLAIGRFPVRTEVELNLMVNKTLAYQTKDYGQTAVFASDKFDGVVSFKNISNSLSSSMPLGWAVEDIHLDDLSVLSAQEQLIAALNRGTALVTFTGHSGPSVWTFSNLFSTKQAATLTNYDRPFVTVQWGCWNTYYVDPTNNYLVQSLLFSGNQGAAAVLGASTLTDSDSEQMLGELLTPNLAQPGMTIGQALQAAKQELGQEHPELSDVLLGWSLMGDPALMIEP